MEVSEPFWESRVWARAKGKARMPAMGTVTALLVSTCCISLLNPVPTRASKDPKKIFRGVSEVCLVVKNVQAMLSTLLSNKFFMVFGYCEIRQSLSELQECDSPQL